MLQELLNALEKELELVARGNGREFTLLNRHQVGSHPTNTSPTLTQIK